MSALAFWKAIVQDRSNFLERVINVLESNSVAYCVIGGVGVNAYVEPVITQDLDVVVATEDLEKVRALLRREFQVAESEHSLNVRDPDSALQFQVQLDPAITEVLPRAQRRDVLGLTLPVASPRDLVRLKSRAAMDPARRRSKSGKDLLDIGRLVSFQPDLWSYVPHEIRGRVQMFVDVEDDEV